VFENNGELLWRQLRDALAGFLTGIWAQGALAGASAEEAFEVRCDRSTMTQNDLDSGRIVARITFRAAMPIVHLTVLLSLTGGGHTSLLPNRAGSTATASPQAA